MTSLSLPEELTVEDLRKPHTSFPANPLIANVLYLADYAQRAGSGTLEMIEQSRAQGTPEPEFVLIRNLEFRSILPRDVFTEDVLNRMGLNERQMKAVRYAKENSSIHLSALKKIFPDVTEKTLYRDLQGLVVKKIFKETGEKRGRKYQIR